MKKINLFGLFLLFGFMVFFSSCGKSEKYDIETVQANDGGNFLVSNLSTDETLQLDGGINISLPASKPTLKAQKGDKIRIAFTPLSKYEKYTFETSYKLYNGDVIKGKQTYEFEITNTESGDYDISLYAKTKEQNISANGVFVLKILN